MTEFNRYEWPILEVCETIKGHISGTGGGLQQDELDRRIDWLRWRVENWEPSRKGFVRVESAIKSLCVETLVLVNVGFVDPVVGEEQRLRECGGNSEMFDAARSGALQAKLRAAGVAFDADAKVDYDALLPKWLKKKSA